MEVLFTLSALISLAGTLILITQKNPVYALLGLLIAFGGSAGVFKALDAPFIAVSQIIIYAGALAVMFLFVLMFTDTRTQDDRLKLPGAVGSRAVFNPKDSGGPAKAKKKKNELQMPPAVTAALDSIQLPKPMAMVLSLSFLVCFTAAIAKLPADFNDFGPLPASYSGALFVPSSSDGALSFGSTAAVSKTIFEGFPLAFEVVSLLIFAALLGAVLLARRHLAGIPGTQDVGKERDHA
ncbi:MAG: NADH-quinone oxidoreductase subunit J [Planctomycetes bacterium]|nr:NADH-quinone oxidoreductase subunit J [Planctomycetota bacterium]